MAGEYGTGGWSRTSRPRFWRPNHALALTGIQLSKTWVDRRDLHPLLAGSQPAGKLLHRRPNLWRLAPDSNREKWLITNQLLCLLSQRAMDLTMGVAPITSALPKQRSIYTNSARTNSGANDRARTGTFLLTRQAHCHSCSVSITNLGILSLPRWRAQPDLNRRSQP